MDTRIYKIELRSLSLGYIQHDSICWTEDRLYRGPYYRSKACPVRIGLRRISTFYIVRKGYKYYEYFSGLPVEDSPDAALAFSPMRAIHVPVPIFSSKVISLAVLEQETVTLSHRERSKLIAKLSEIYAKACKEADLYEKNKLKEVSLNRS